MTAYVLYHKDCGHPLALSANRANLETHDSPHTLRIAFATNRDIEAFANGERCDTCSTETGPRPAAPRTSAIQRAANQPAQPHPNT